jgi:hypothetical protein
MTKILPGCALVAALLAVTGQISASELSEAAKFVEGNLPNYVFDVAVVDDGGAIKIIGKARDSSAVSKYLRYLDEHVGAPSLISMTRDGTTSVFEMRVQPKKQ